MNPHRVNYYQELGQTLSVPNGWVLIEAISNLDKTKKFLGDIKEGLERLETVKKDVAVANAENNRLADDLEARQAALAAERQAIEDEKEKHAVAVAAFKPKIDALGERERLAEIEAGRLRQRNEELDSREESLRQLRVELDGRATALKQEKAETEAKFANLKALLAAVPSQES